jgi:hypothetical protein
MEKYSLEICDKITRGFSWVLLSIPIIGLVVFFLVFMYFFVINRF